MRALVLVVTLAAACGDDGHQHVHASDDATMRVATTPAPAIAGQPATIQVALLAPGGGPATGLQLSHERWLHTVIFSEDLNTFAHLHQEDTAPVTDEDLAMATFEMPHMFPAAGNYLVAGDWCRNDLPGHGQVALAVDGEPSMTAEDADTALVKVVDGYQITLSSGGVPHLDGSPIEITIRDGSGADVTDLEMYLGAEMHLSAIWQGLGLALHTHPSTGGAHEHCGPPREQVYFGPTIPFEIDFPVAGRWKLWGQFQHRGQAHTVGFLLDVILPAG